MKVGSLFAGIGGFDLGLERAGFKISWQVEIDPYCQRVLAKHWPNVQRYGDIRAIDWGTVPRVDLLCGGFPCQDLSFAGKRAGIDGERSGLWSEYVRAIRALRPRYILVENVPGLLTNEYMGRVLGDLAQSGYDAEWDCLPASAFGAPHRRDRVWLVANTKGDRTQNGCERLGGICETHTSIGLSELPSVCGEALADSDGERLEKRGRRYDTGRSYASIDRCDWWAVEPELGRVAHGIPHRVDRLKGLGNAIVPQIAEWLGRQIMNVAQQERSL